jgi:hypothetical protein
MIWAIPGNAITGSFSAHFVFINLFKYSSIKKISEGDNTLHFPKMGY